MQRLDFAFSSAPITEKQTLILLQISVKHAPFAENILIYVHHCIVFHIHAKLSVTKIYIVYGDVLIISECQCWLRMSVVVDYNILHWPRSRLSVGLDNDNIYQEVLSPHDQLYKNACTKLERIYMCRYRISYRRQEQEYSLINLRFTAS